MLLNLKKHQFGNIYAAWTTIKLPDKPLNYCGQSLGSIQNKLLFNYSFQTIVSAMKVTFELDPSWLEPTYKWKQWATRSHCKTIK